MEGLHRQLRTRRITPTSTGPLPRLPRREPPCPSPHPIRPPCSGSRRSAAWLLLPWAAWVVRGRGRSAALASWGWAGVWLVPGPFGGPGRGGWPPSRRCTSPPGPGFCLVLRIRCCPSTTWPLPPSTASLTRGRGRLAAWRRVVELVRGGPGSVRRGRVVTAATASSLHVPSGAGVFAWCSASVVARPLRGRYRPRWLPLTRGRGRSAAWRRAVGLVPWLVPGPFGGAGSWGWPPSRRCTSPPGPGSLLGAPHPLLPVHYVAVTALVGIPRLAVGGRCPGGGPESRGQARSTARHGSRRVQKPDRDATPMAWDCP
ncbi:hypothetical protein ABIA38_008928 [Embleya sp. AB8]